MLHERPHEYHWLVVKLHDDSDLLRIGVQPTVDVAFALGLTLEVLGGDIPAVAVGMKVDPAAAWEHRVGVRPAVLFGLVLLTVERAHGDHRDASRSRRCDSKSSV